MSKKPYIVLLISHLLDLFNRNPVMDHFALIIEKNC